MTKGAENQMKHLTFVLLLLAFSLAGCAHRHVTIPSFASLDHNEEITISAKEQTPSNQGEAEKDPFDDDLDFFGVEEVAKVADPLAPWNRAMFHFNDKLYFWVLKPVARGYRAVIPTPVRSGVKNFFHNLTTPVRMAGCILQGKGRAASAELTRFLINSTVGVLGFGNPAKRWSELNPGEEDLGQTLGTYGIGNGFYIVWPVLGPSTLRDSVGMVGDWLLKPTSYVRPTEASVEIWAAEKVNGVSFQIGDYESLKEAALDPYVSVRDLYIQYRMKKVKE